MGKKSEKFRENREARANSMCTDTRPFDVNRFEALKPKKKMKFVRKPEMKRLMIAALAPALFAGTASAATLVAIDDTTLLKSSDTDTGGRLYNYGGRGEVIIGNNGTAATPRYGIFRFDITTIAAQITAGYDILSATLTLTERTTGDATHSTTTRTLTAHGITAANAGWVEGTSNGALEAGTASLSYRNTQSTQAASTDWASGGATPTAGDLFTFGTDTGASLGSGSVTFATGTQQTVVITITELAALKTLLGQWQTQGATTNAGLALQASGDGQTFWDSNETSGGSPATLNITFVPEPSSLALLGLGGLLMAARRKR
jgi:hypothetical protein